MDCYFEDVFKKLERDSLFSRTKRREMVQYFCTLIAGCAKGMFYLFIYYFQNSCLQFRRQNLIGYLNLLLYLIIFCLMWKSIVLFHFSLNI